LDNHELASELPKFDTQNQAGEEMPVSRVVAVNPSLVVERVGSDYLMLTASGAEVVRATGDAAEVITCAINGQPLPDHLHAAADVLQRHGVLTTTTSVTTASVTTANTFTPSRRHALQLGAAAAAVGLTMLALPNAAAAASTPTWFETDASVRTGCLGDQFQSSDIVFPDPGTFTFTVTSGPRDVVIFLIGGGGSGSNRLQGGGGGGGQFGFTPPVTLTAGDYTITVGAGGAAVIEVGDGNDGGLSRVLGVYEVVGGEGGIGGSGGESGSGTDGGLPGDNSGGGGGGEVAGQAGSGPTGGNGGTGDIFPYSGYPSGAVAGGGGGAGNGGDGVVVPNGGSGSGGGGNGGDGGDIGTFTTIRFPAEAQAGTANTGGGGGGGWNGMGSGAGGSGVVVIRFTDSSCPIPDPV